MNLKQWLAIGLAVGEVIFNFLGGEDDEQPKKPKTKRKSKSNKKQKEASDGSGK